MIKYKINIIITKIMWKKFLFKWQRQKRTCSKFLRIEIRWFSYQKRKKKNQTTFFSCI